MKKQRSTPKPRIPVIEDGRHAGQPIVGFKDDSVPPAHHATWRNSLKAPRWLRESLLPLACVLIIAITKAATLAPVGTTLEPVSVSLTSPFPGAVMSNTITLSASASSLTSRVERVEFYETHLWTNYATHQVFMVTNLIGTAYRPPFAPQGFNTRPL